MAAKNTIDTQQASSSGGVAAPLFTDEQLDQAQQRAELVGMLDRLRREGKLSNGQIVGRVVRFARTRYPSISISKSTLYRWSRVLFTNGGDVSALVDQRATNPRHLPASPEAVAHFVGLLFKPQRPSMREAWRQTHQLAKANGWQWCSYSSVKNHVERWTLTHTLTHGSKSRERPSKPLR